MANEDFSPNLDLPYLLPNQAQKHVTVNESLRTFDVLVMASVEEIGTETPPVSPTDGQCWIIGAAPSGDWTGKAGQLVAWQDGAWMFHTPHAGWRVWDRSVNAFTVFNGTSWSGLDAGGGSGGGLTDTQNLGYVGLATLADAANPFSARLNAALWTAREVADGGTGDLRITMNRETDTDTGSLLFQTGYSGRAEIGLTGDAYLTFKVSADNLTWTRAIIIDPVTGNVGFGRTPVANRALTVSGIMEMSAPEGYVRLEPNGRVYLREANGADTQLISRSAGSTLQLGATRADGALNSMVLSLDPDAERIVSDYTVAPRTSAAADLGGPSEIWRDVYLENAPVVTSDRRTKTAIEPLVSAPELVAALQPVSFQKRADGSKHFGFIAQDVREALEATGHEGGGLWFKAKPADEDSLQALRQEELIPVLVAAVQALTARVASLELVTGRQT